MDATGTTHQYDTDVVFLQVQYDGFGAGLEGDQLTGLGVVQAVHAGNTVTDLKYGAVLFQLGGRIESRKLLLQDCGDFVGLYVSHAYLLLVVELIYVDVGFA